MNNIKIENGTDARLPNLLKALMFSFLITLISIFLFAIILTYTNISEKTIPIFITVLTFISILIGTIIGTRNIRKNGMLNGAIIGVGYVILLYLISSILNTGFAFNVYTILMIVTGIISGIIGGIVGINI